MNEQVKAIEHTLLGVYVTCRQEWVAQVLKQIEELKVGDIGVREEHGFVQRCQFGPIGAGIRVDAALAIWLTGGVELRVVASARSDPVPAVVLVGGTGDKDDG